MGKKLLISIGVLLMLGGILAVVWIICDWPPPRLILKYGLPPAGGPTGRRLTTEGIEFIELGPGYFRMGSHEGCTKGDCLGRVCAMMGLPWGATPDHSGDTCPPHFVEIGASFWLAKNELTNDQFRRFNHRHRPNSSSPQDSGPANGLPWSEAKEFTIWLSIRSGLNACMPSEAQWEFACQVEDGPVSCGRDLSTRIGRFAWHRQNSAERAHPVGSLSPNRWGFFDMHGNVSEWCEDAYEIGYAEAPRDGTAFKTKSPGIFRVSRGGGFLSEAEDFRHAIRFCVGTSLLREMGFRPALAVRTPGEFD